MQESNRTPNSFQFKKQIKNNFIHKQHEELPRKEEISSQLAILKKENEELKRENDELKRKLNEKSEKQSNIINEVKVEINKIKQILSNAQQQRFIYPFENIDTESIGSIEKVGEIQNSSERKSIKVLIQKVYELKEISDKNFKKENLQRLLDEFEIMNMLHHPNIQKAHRLIIDDKKLPPSILLEYFPLNLEEVMKKKMLSKVQQVFSIYQIAEAMKYIHSRKIVHQNLNPSNIHISEDGIIKIGGFENSQIITNDEEQSKEMDDVYSFGVISYFILSGGEIPEVKNETSLKEFPLLAQQLIGACWFDDIESRPTFEIICEVLEKNNFNLTSLSQQEINEVSQMINQYKKQV